MLPFLKWAGGKRWFFTRELLNSLPRFERYIEPFLGGGAGFFALKPKSAILSDLNVDLIASYLAMRDFPVELASALARHQALHSDQHYYYVRALRPSDDVAAAARFMYLNRACWNGLYRVNKAGHFNVPKGTKSAILLDSDDFTSSSKLLKRAELYCCDFETVIDRAGPGDLIFADPPYTVKHNFNGFVKYNEEIFSWKDQMRLAECLARADKRGARIIVTNADHESVRELYSSQFTIESVARSSVISGLGKGRTGVTEMVARN